MTKPRLLEILGEIPDDAVLEFKLGGQIVDLISVKVEQITTHTMTSKDTSPKHYVRFNLVQKSSGDVF